MARRRHGRSDAGVRHRRAHCGYDPWRAGAGVSAPFALAPMLKLTAHAQPALPAESGASVQRPARPHHARGPVATSATSRTARRHGHARFSARVTGPASPAALEAALLPLISNEPRRRDLQPRRRTSGSTSKCSACRWRCRPPAVRTAHVHRSTSTHETHFHQTRGSHDKDATFRSRRRTAHPGWRARPAGPVAHLARHHEPLGPPPRRRPRHDRTNSRAAAEAKPGRDRDLRDRSGRAGDAVAVTAVHTARSSPMATALGPAARPTCAPRRDHAFHASSSVVTRFGPPGPRG